MPESVPINGGGDRRADIYPFRVYWLRWTPFIFWPRDKVMVKRWNGDGTFPIASRTCWTWNGRRTFDEVVAKVVEVIRADHA